MFNNLVNRDDLLLLIEKIKRGEWRKISSKLSQLRRNKEENVKRYWEDPSTAQNEPIHWWDIPAVKYRWNYLVSGHTDVDHVEYVSRKYLGKGSLRALSLGCGTGARELRWAALGKFQSIDGYDVSEENIKSARKGALEAGYGDILTYHVGDVYRADIKKGYYDVVIIEHSLHHFSPLKEILLKVQGLVKSDGYFLVNEFVGPSRFQWSDRQLEATNSLLSLLPVRYRMMWGGTSIKSKVEKPSRLSMFLKDPSEAVESKNIMPLLEEMFDIVETTGYGGNLLHLLFTGIAGNFLSDDSETHRVLRFCFDAEDIFLGSDGTSSDFVVAVCRKRC